MTDITCTITKNGRCDKYGRPLIAGSSYTGAFDEVRSLYLAGFATVVDVSIFDDDSAPSGSYFAPIPVGTKPASAVVDPVTGGSEILLPDSAVPLVVKKGKVVVDRVTTPAVTPVGYVPFFVTEVDDSYYYGIGSPDTKLVRVPKSLTSATPEVIYTFSSTLRKLFKVGRYYFAVVMNDGSDTSDSIWISTDGVSYTKRLTLGTFESLIYSEVRTLSRGTICVATIGGVETILIGEYNIAGTRTSGATNDRVILWASTDGGVTFAPAGGGNAVWNTSGHQTRHIHVVKQDPQSGWIYISFGDSDAESATIAWNGVAPFTRNTAHSALDGIDGFRVGPLTQRGRSVDFVFADDWIYAASDAAQGAMCARRDCGIWRYKRDFSQQQRVDSKVLRHLNHVMMYGRADAAGRMLWCSGPESNATSTDRYIVVYTSQTGDSWDAVGRVTLTPGTGGALPGELIYDKYANNFVLSSLNGAGKATAFATVFGVGTEQWQGVEPDPIHPAYFVASGGVDDTSAERGLYPHAPWASLGFALNNTNNGNKITFGGAIYLPSGDAVLDGAVFRCEGNAAPGSAKIPFALIGRGRAVTNLVQPSNGSGAQALSFDTSTNAASALKLRKLTFKTRKTGLAQLFLAGSMSSGTRALVIDDAVVGTESLYFTAALMVLRSFTLTLQNRARLVEASQGAQLSPACVKMEGSGVGVAILVKATAVIEGGNYNVYAQNNASSTITIEEGAVFIGQGLGNPAILVDSGMALKPTIAAGAIFLCDGAGLTEYKLIGGSTAYAWSSDYSGLRSNLPMSVTGSGTAFANADVNSAYVIADSVGGDVRLTTA